MLTTPLFIQIIAQSGYTLFLIMVSDLIKMPIITVSSQAMTDRHPDKIDMTRTLFTFYLIFLTSVLFSQHRKYYVVNGDSVRKWPRISLGSRHNGIGFGNFVRYNGIRTSIVDHDSLNNGVSLSIAQPLNGYKTTNGIDGTFLFSTLDVLNSIGFSIVWLNVEEGNGATVSGIGSDVSKINGVHLCGLVTLSTNYINGICFSGVANVIFKSNGVLVGGLYNVVDSCATGISVSGLFQKTESFSGLSIAPVNITNNGKGVQLGLFNKAINLRGVQFGLININRRKNHFKIMPFINFSFKKNKADT